MSDGQNSFKTWPGLNHYVNKKRAEAFFVILILGDVKSIFCQHLSTLSPDLEVLTSVDTFGCLAPHGYKVRELSTAQSSRVVSQLSEKSYDIKIGSVVAENEAKT